jgi:hypothetical protein
MENLTKIESGEGEHSATVEHITIKVEPILENLSTSIDIEEHPVKLEDEEDQSGMFCDLPAPNTEISDQEQTQGVHSIG